MHRATAMYADNLIHLIGGAPLVVPDLKSHRKKSVQIGTSHFLYLRHMDPATKPPTTPSQKAEEATRSQISYIYIYFRDYYKDLLIGVLRGG